MVYLGILCTGSISSSLNPTFDTPSVLYFEAWLIKIPNFNRSTLKLNKQGRTDGNEIGKLFSSDDHISKHRLRIFTFIVVGLVAVERAQLFELPNKQDNIKINQTPPVKSRSKERKERRVEEKQTNMFQSDIAHPPFRSHLLLGL